MTHTTPAADPVAGSQLGTASGTVVADGDPRRATTTHTAAAPGAWMSDLPGYPGSARPTAIADTTDMASVVLAARIATPLRRAALATTHTRESGSDRTWRRRQADQQGQTPSTPRQPGAEEPW